MYFSKSFLNTSQDDSTNEINQMFLNTIGDILPEFFYDKPLFSEDNYSLYYYDEYVTGTCVTEKSVPTLYLEINQPDNIKNWVKKKNRHTYPELYFSLNSIRDGLFDFFVDYFDSNTLIWKDNYYINFSINMYNEDDVKNVNFRIVPCITYTNENNEQGIMYFNETMRNLIIEYPHIAIQKFREKNKNCVGLYRDYCIIFKNIFKNVKDEKVLPSEIFETILYNVPNLFFENHSVDNLNKIINYIRNSNILNYKTIDEQDFAFVTSYRPMNIVYVKHAIRKLESYIKKMK